MNYNKYSKDISLKTKISLRLQRGNLYYFYYKKIENKLKRGKNYFKKKFVFKK